VFHRAYTAMVASAESNAQEIKENINLMRSDIEVKKTVFDVLPKKSQKLSMLFEISNQFTNIVDVAHVYDCILSTLVRVFPFADDILIFDIRGEHDTLFLIRSKHRKGDVIKEKKGDILDTWVVRNNQSILVDDLSKDFRFDYNRVIASHERHIMSFIASPLSVGERMMGAVRIESREVSRFSQDDFRILRCICDLAAVVLERSVLFRDIENLAILDHLTSLFLRDYFFARLKDQINHCASAKKHFGLIMIDIDNFKTINDTYGHVVGDIILKRTAKIFSSIAGGHNNVCCRFGGEEFIALISGCTPQQLHDTANDVCKAVASCGVAFRRKQINFTVSGGAAIYPNDGVDSLTLLDKVDQLLYKAKKSGKNKICHNLKL
jgi:diguanylate cyclase (GGDEF)-like protein